MIYFDIRVERFEGFGVIGVKRKCRVLGFCFLYVFSI